MAPRFSKVVATAKQRRALTSPIRLEIIGHFMSPGAMSIADIAERMGRTPGSLYYHFKVLEKVGLVHRVGSRPGVKKSEALFELAASRIELPSEPAEKTVADLSKTLAAAFRMAERDVEAALRAGNTRTKGRHRTLHALRLHFRVTKDVLAEVNDHLEAIEKALFREARRRKLPPDADQYCSLTIALAPLRGRGRE